MHSDSERGMDIERVCAISSQRKWAELCAGRDRVAEAAEVRLFSLAHQLEVQRLLAEGTLGWGVGLQPQAHLLPCVHQPLCRGKNRVHFDKSQIHHFTLALNVYYTTVTRLLDLLTNKVFHHLRGVVRCWGDTQKLISPGNGGIIDGLHVNAVTTHHEVTHLCVFLSIGYLEIIQRQPQPLERGEMLLIVM